MDGSTPASPRRRSDSLRIRLRGASAYDKLTHAYAPAAFAYVYPSHDTT